MLKILFEMRRKERCGEFETAMSETTFCHSGTKSRMEKITFLARFSC